MPIRRPPDSHPRSFESCHQLAIRLVEQINDAIKAHQSKQLHVVPFRLLHGLQEFRVDCAD